VLLRSHADVRRFLEQRVSPEYLLFLGNLVTKIVDGSERNPGDLYRAEKERRHTTMDSRRRCVALVRSARRETAQIHVA